MVDVVLIVGVAVVLHVQVIFSNATTVVIVSAVWGMGQVQPVPVLVVIPVVVQGTLALLRWGVGGVRGLGWAWGLGGGRSGCLGR